jgi:methylthioribose-1-phosphate isomerase
MGVEDDIRAVQWRDGQVILLDQRLLPGAERYLGLTSADEVAGAIADMVVRGAPAIGITAAYGVVLAAAAGYRAHGERWRRELGPALEPLRRARPTAVNLAWAIARMTADIDRIDGDPLPALLARARALHEDDVRANRTMGKHGAACFDRPVGVLTHCNTGSLATGGFGTALGVIRTAHAEGRLREVYAGETRPWLQGARLTAWELAHDAIPMRLIADGAAAYLMQTGAIDWVIVGADRIAANGDVANKIGTYSLAVAARAHGLRVMVVAPTSTIDPGAASALDIPIEERDPGELLAIGGRALAPSSCRVWNPVFDLTPAPLIDVLVTEKGVVERPDRDKIALLLRG